MKYRFTIALLVAMVLTGSCSEQDNAQYYKPSEISFRIADSVMACVRRGEISSQEEFNTARNGFAIELVDSMLTEGLDELEKFEGAKVMFWSSRREQAKIMFRELGEGQDELGQKAAIELITMEIEDGAWESAENLMKDYRTKHPPDPDDPVNLSMCVDDLAGRYNNEDRPEDAIRVILDELNHLPFNYPYPSFYLIEGLIPLMIETARLDELRKLAGKYRDNFANTHEEHLSQPQPEDSTTAEYNDMMEAIKSRIEHLENILARLKLIGNKAPGINSIHCFNMTPPFSMDHLAGKVIIMDFWATWCVACVIGYQELNEIRNEYKERDVAILGITSLQGQYSDVASGKREGSKDTPLTKDREIQLTMEYIKKSNMVWPCIVSDRSVIDPEYFINGLPTSILLDRDGIVRYMHVGVGRKQQMRRVLNKLLDGN